MAQRLLHPCQLRQLQTGRAAHDVASKSVVIVYRYKALTSVLLSGIRIYTIDPRMNGLIGGGVVR
jgi:hypothetical protein